MSYLIDLNKKYERFKLVLKERNRLREMDREIRRKFPFYQNLSLDNTMKSIESLNETLTKPVEQKLKLYLNHSNTYSFDEKKRRNQEKLNTLKSNMSSYIKGLTIQKFDGDDFLKKKKEKYLKAVKNKTDNLKTVKKKANEFIEPVNKKIEERRNSRNSKKINEGFKQKLKELEQKEHLEAERLEKEHEKLLKRLDDLSSKREEYKDQVQKTRIVIKNQEDRYFENKVRALEEKDDFLERKKEETISQILKNKSLHEEKLEEIRRRAYENEQKEEEINIQRYLEQFKGKYEKSLKKREETLKKKIVKRTVEEKAAFDVVKNNREKMQERLKNKEAYFKKKLKIDGEKVKRAQNIKEFIRRKTINEDMEKFQKFRENKEELDEFLHQKKNSVMMKQMQNKKKIEFNRKENDFVVEERRDYNTKLIQYRDSLLDHIKV